MEDRKKAGRARPRGRGRAEMALSLCRASAEPKPGTVVQSQDDEFEDWECGMKTAHAVKSVTYVNKKTVPLACLPVESSSSPTTKPVKAVKSQSKGSIVNARPDDDGSSDEDHPKWDFGDRQTASSASASSSMGKKQDGLKKPTLVRPSPPERTTIFTARLKRECSICMSIMESTWTKKGSSMQQITQQLQECFEMVSNPYVTVLYMIEHARDYSSNKSSTLSHQIAKDFERYIRQTREYDDLLESCGKNLKIYAFTVATRIHMTSFNVIVKAFQLCHPGNDYFLPYVEPFVYDKEFKKASQCIARLDLYRHFNMKQIVLPLIVQDKINMVEDYVYQNREQQHNLLKLLDSLCVEDLDVTALADEINVKNGNFDKVRRKAVVKLAMRLLKLYQIPLEDCPNIHCRHATGAVGYLLYEFYGQDACNRESWREMIELATCGIASVQADLVDRLVTVGDMSEAVYWAKKCNLSDDQLPIQVVEALTAERDTQDDAGLPSGVQDGDDWDTALLTQSDYYHVMRLPMDCLHFIDTKEGFYEFVDYISQPGGMVGIDAEWRPSFGQDLVTKVALLQFGTMDCVYLVDVLTLNNILDGKDWKQLDRLFCSDEVVKLGYGLSGDVQMIVKTIPALEKGCTELKRFVELQQLQNQVTRQCPDMFRSQKPVNVTAAKKLTVTKSEERGLSELVRLCLGKPLDKAEQMSDWERRPLRKAQIIYAALDALTLVDIYQFIMEKVREYDLDVDFEPSFKGSKSATPHKSRAQRRQERVAEKASIKSKDLEGSKSDRPPIPPSQFSVVVDNMIQGMGRYLRNCGVDVRILDNTEDHDVAAEIARREGRVILTCGQPYTWLKGQVPEGMCYLVTNGLKARDQAIDVLEHYNVHVSERDIFSRCQVCNGSGYKYIDAKTMQKAWDRRARLLAEKKHTLSSARTRPSMSDVKIKKSVLENLRDVKYDVINMEDVSLDNGVLVQVENIPRDMTSQMNLFFVCSTCGKVYWKGKHFDGVCSQFASVLTLEKWG